MSEDNSKLSELNNKINNLRQYCGISESIIQLTNEEKNPKKQ